MYACNDVLDTAGAWEPRKGEARLVWACRKPAHRELWVVRGSGGRLRVITPVYEEGEVGRVKPRDRVRRVETCATGDS